MDNTTLPGPEMRLELLENHIFIGAFKISDNVCLDELAELTKNFTKEELRQFLLKASIWAVTRSPPIDPKDLVVTLEDFFATFKEMDPRFGVQTEKLEHLMPGGFFDWIRPDQQMESKPDDLNKADESRLNIDFNGKYERESEEEAAGCSKDFILSPEMAMAGLPGITDHQVVDKYVSELLMNSRHQGLRCQLIEGAPKSGKSAIAARCAQKSNVPFIKVILPADFLEASTPEKCRRIRKILSDAYVSQDSIVIFDDLERLLEYDPLGKDCSNEVLQMLMVLLKKQPPRGHKLNILCTSSNRDVLDKLGMLSVFTSVTHVPNLSRPEHILSVAQALQRFEREELLAIGAAIVDQPISIGIKRLLELIIWSSSVLLKPDRRVAKFLETMGSEMGW